MTDTFVPVPASTAGYKIATMSRSQGADTVQDQVPAPMFPVSSSGTINSTSSTSALSLSLLGRPYVSVAFDDQTAFGGTIGVKALNGEGQYEHRIIWDGNRWPRTGLATFPNGVTGPYDGTGVTFAVVLEPGDTAVQVFCASHSSGTVGCKITASGTPNAIAAFGSGAAMFIDGGNPSGSDSAPYVGLAIGGNDSSTGGNIGRMIAVQRTVPTGSESGVLTRPIGLNTTSGTLSAVNDAVTLDMAGMTNVQFDIDSTTLNGTLVAECLVGNTWRNTLIQNGSTLAWTGVGLASPSAGAYLILTVPGAKKVRVRCSVRTSGSATVYMTATSIVSAAVMVPHLVVGGFTAAPLLGTMVAGATSTGQAQFLPVRQDSAATYAVAIREARTSAWSKYHTPAVNTKATIASSAAGSGKRNIARSITLTFSGSTTAPAAGTVTAGLYDGTSSGTLLWQTRLALPAVAGAMNGVSVAGFWKGTANKAMTLRFNSTGYLNAFQSVAMTGDVVTEA